MSVSVERVTSEVTVDAEPGQAGPASASAETAVMKDFLAQMARDRARTAAEGFDD